MRISTSCSHLESASTKLWAPLQALYPEFNPSVSLKALSYFGDVSRLPEKMQRDLTVAASRVREIPRINRLSASLLPDSDSIGMTWEAGEAEKTKGRREPEMEI